MLERYPQQTPVRSIWVPESDDSVAIWPDSTVLFGCAKFCIITTWQFILNYQNVSGASQTIRQSCLGRLTHNVFISSHTAAWSHASFSCCQRVWSECPLYPNVLFSSVFLQSLFNFVSKMLFQLFDLGSCFPVSLDSQSIARLSLSLFPLNSHRAMTEPEKWQPKFGPSVKEVVCMQPVPLTNTKGLPGQLLANIDHLSNELLMQIFQLCICASIIAFPSCDVHHHLKRQLVSVSRCWKNIILNSANFWTTIKLTPTWSKSFVKVHLARSSESSLNIEMCGWWPSNAFVSFTMHSLLDLITCSHCWCSVVIWWSAPHAQLIQLLSMMKDKMFPSLTCFSVKYIDGWLCNSWMAPQLCTENFPWLQHLELGGPFDPSPAGQALSNLASLALRLNDWDLHVLSSTLPFRS